MIREQSRTLCQLDERFVARLYALVPNRSRAEVEDVLRISWNTWIKIRAHEPIRYSLALRLVTRVLGMEHDTTDPMAHLRLTSGGPSLARQRRGPRLIADEKKMQPPASHRAATGQLARVIAPHDFSNAPACQLKEKEVRG